MGQKNRQAAEMIFDLRPSIGNRGSLGQLATDQVPSAASVPVPSGPSLTDEVTVMTQLGGLPDTLLRL